MQSVQVCVLGFGGGAEAPLGCILFMCLFRFCRVLQARVHREHRWVGGTRLPGWVILIHLTVEVRGRMPKCLWCRIHFMIADTEESECMRDVMSGGQALEYTGHSSIWEPSRGDVPSQKQGEGGEVPIGSEGSQPLLERSLKSTTESSLVWWRW